MKDGRDEKKNIMGPLLRRLRKRRGLTQKEFSKMLREAGWKKCTRSWLSRIESGEVVLRDANLPFFHAVLGPEFGKELEVFMTKRAEMLKAEVGMVNAERPDSR